ncbi:MAG: hypothetical protein GY796_02500 [Chloroflexi bacterium]|nr:hypothetical protein [Chloroflexota bacterium]
MVTSLEKLQWDLDILETMADEMEDFLKSDVLYWQMTHGNMPKLTLGGYLLRQYRLRHLADLLDAGQRDRLDTAVAQFQAALVEKVVVTEKRAHEELGVRCRQWGTYMNDVKRETALAAVNYETAVENRAAIAALIDFLHNPPYQMGNVKTDSLKMMDSALRIYWVAGSFVWPTEWAAAYPQDKYWWLYGRPK